MQSRWRTTPAVSFAAEGMPLPTSILDRLEGSGLATAPIRTDLITGRVFFSDLGAPPTEVLPLTEVLAREIGSSLEQLYPPGSAKNWLPAKNASRVARDLHDGVLQALTGVRLELRALAKALRVSDDGLEQRLVSIERALRHGAARAALHRRSRAGQCARPDALAGLAKRLDSVRERLALEWQTPVTVRLSPGVPAIPEPLQEAVPLMVHEAAVNALKHAQPSRASPSTSSRPTARLRIAVTDDGQGFPLQGRLQPRYTCRCSRCTPQPVRPCLGTRRTALD